MERDKSKKSLSAEDKELLHRFNEGAYEAFTEIYQLYWEKFYHYVLSLLKDEDKAQDVLQDVFADLWELRGKLDHVQSLKAYIFSMVRSRTLQVLHAEKRIPQEQIDLFDDLIAYSQWNVLDNIAASEVEQAIAQIVDNMPERMRQAFIQSRYEGLSHKEISAEMGISDLTIKKQIQHSLRILREKLSHFMTFFF